MLKRERDGETFRMPPALQATTVARLGDWNWEVFGLRELRIFAQVAVSMLVRRHGVELVLDEIV